MSCLRRVAWTLALLVCCAACDDEPSWTAQELGADATFLDVFFLDAERGWIVGGGYPVEGGIVGSTVDGGRTWSFDSGLVYRSTNPHTVHLHSVWFLDERRGFIAADGGRILRTVDGGWSWLTQASGTDSFLTGVHFVDRSTGWAVGFKREDSSSVVLHTDDGGRTWTQQARVVGEALFALAFREAGFGWTVGERVRPHPQHVLRFVERASAE